MPLSSASTARKTQIANSATAATKGRQRVTRMSYASLQPFGTTKPSVVEASPVPSVRSARVTHVTAPWEKSTVDSRPGRRILEGPSSTASLPQGRSRTPPPRQCQQDIICPSPTQPTTHSAMRNQATIARLVQASSINPLPPRPKPQVKRQMQVDNDVFCLREIPTHYRHSRRQVLVREASKADPNCMSRSSTPVRTSRYLPSRRGSNGIFDTNPVRSVTPPPRVLSGPRQSEMLSIMRGEAQVPQQRYGFRVSPSASALMGSQLI